MSSPREVWRQAGADLGDLDASVRALTSQLFVVADETGGVEVTLNGQGRMVDLRLDPRQLSLGAAELSRTINETIWAAQDFIESSLAEDFVEIEERASQLLDQTRLFADDATGEPTL